MRHPIVVGLQYGDEGKGKITDTLARQADFVIRFNGGNNAGHTLWLEGKKLVTHSVPSGVLSSHAVNFIGAGCVLDPVAFTKELEELVAAGVDLGPERLKIDFRVHLIFPLHRNLDKAREGSATAQQSIGTTLRGIGPTYSTKMDRIGVRAGDLLEPDVEERVEKLVRHANFTLKGLGLPETELKENLEVLALAKSLISKHVSREFAPFYKSRATKKCVLEGAQGILLDLDHGSYPFVTSSNTLGAYAAVGTPFPLGGLGPVVGVAKAYLTRVGNGPFPTELKNETGERIRQNGGEFGATTGRARRTGWLNLDELRAGVQIADVSTIVLTKSDVLCGEKEVFALLDGELKRFEGWPSLTEGSALHPNFETFVAFIEKAMGIPVCAIGTGPDRTDVYWRHKDYNFWPT
ncbi:MAG TPA: adenylosuccinate synthetase [Bdellovibrionota bacterium]|nr:adenylosuccinate synthetase [Bdellovibrionota bacterium]